MDDDLPIDDNNAADQEPEENFAEMFESYAAGMNEDIQVGDKIHGRIIAITDSALFIDTGTKADGVVEIEELKDTDGQLPYSVGDSLDLYVVSADESEIRLSRALAGAGGLNMLKEAQANGIPVEGKVLQTVKGGFQVEVLKRRAFCAISQMDTQYVENPDQYLGQTYQFAIKKLTEGGRNIVVSRRDLLEVEQQKLRQAFMQTLAVDQLHSGRVTRVMPFGAFVELAPGVEGMVHISELSWSRLEKVEDAVKPGDKLQVKVLRIEPGAKQKKIALSAKQALGDPWELVEKELSAGQKVSGKVTRCANFGAFVELRPGIEGLVHISELSYTQRVHKPEDVVQPGQMVSVVIKEIDKHKRRLSLSLRDAQGDPWLDVEEKFTPGQPVEGIVEKQEKFGIFVTLTPGIVGLLPKSAISRSSQAGQIEKLKAGDRIAVAVETIQAAERKISLKLRDSSDEQNWRQFATDSGDAPLGALGEKLAQALKKDE